MFKTLGDYRRYRRELGSDSLMHYLKKIFLPFILSSMIFFILAAFDVSIDHKAVAGILVSVNAIVIAFLVFSMTILITKENKSRIKNTTIKYVDLLISNTEVNATLAFVSIVVNLLYLYFANPKGEVSGEYYLYFLEFISFSALFLTLFVVKFSIDDLLFITRSYRNRAEVKIKDYGNSKL